MKNFIDIRRYSNLRGYYLVKEIRIFSRNSVIVLGAIRETY